MPLDPPSGRTSHALYYALPSIAIKCTLEPPFSNPRSATGISLVPRTRLPLVYVYVFHQTIGLSSLDYWLSSVHVCHKYNTTNHQTFESTCVNELHAPASF